MTSSHKSPRLNRIHTIESGDLVFVRMRLVAMSLRWSNDPFRPEPTLHQKAFMVLRRECCRIYYRTVGDSGSKVLGSEGWLDLSSDVVDSWEIVK